MNQLAYGAPPKLGAGNACSRCFTITGTADPYSPSYTGPFHTIIVKVTDLWYMFCAFLEENLFWIFSWQLSPRKWGASCVFGLCLVYDVDYPSRNSVDKWCWTRTTKLNQHGEPFQYATNFSLLAMMLNFYSFDVCKDTGGASSFFPSGHGALTGTFNEVLCSQWTGTNRGALWNGACLAGETAGDWPSVGYGNQDMPCLSQNHLHDSRHLLKDCSLNRHCPRWPFLNGHSALLVSSVSWDLALAKCMNYDNIVRMGKINMISDRKEKPRHWSHEQGF